VTQGLSQRSHTDSGLATGRHLLIDLYTRSELLTDPLLMERSIRAAADACGATLLQYHSQGFSGGGLTAFAMLAESHISSHTWPEHEFAAFDVFTCGPHTDPHLACRVLEQFYLPRRIEVRDITRGDEQTMPDGRAD